MTYSEIYSCNFCMETTKSPVHKGWLKLEPMGVFLNKPKQITETLHFCSLEHLGHFLDWKNGIMPPQEVERYRE